MTTDNKQVCEFCGWETDRVVEVSPPHYPYNGTTRIVCGLCYNTVSSSWYQDERTYTSDQKFMLASINMSLNYVMENMAQ